MEAENRAGRVLSGRSSRETLTIDPISDLLDMALGLDVFRSAPKQVAQASGTAGREKLHSRQARPQRRSERR